MPGLCYLYYFNSKTIYIKLIFIHNFLKIIIEEECYNSLTNLISSKKLVFVTQTKLLYEVTWRIIMDISKKHIVRKKNINFIYLVYFLI